MLTDMDVAHGVDHVDHMGTEAWRCEQIHRIEQLGPLMGDIGEPLKHIEVVPLEEPAFFPTFEALVLAFPPTIDGARPVEGVA